MEQSSPWTFSSQYMQNPVPPEGGIFRPDSIEIVDSLPKKLRLRVRAWDLAATANDGDWTVGVLMGQTYDNRHVIEDVVRLQGTPDKVEAAIVSTAKQDGQMVRVSIPQDPGQAGKSQVAYLTRALSGFRVFSSPESGDKITRAEPLASQVNVGAVSMFRGDWNKTMIHELRNFPFAKHDDHVDAAARAFNTINEASTYDSSLSWVS
jgi:predicted phage terminase large subunit-like protein